MLKAICPVDGRYSSKTVELQDYFSEYALIRERVFVEVQYFITLLELPLPQLSNVSSDLEDRLVARFNQFSETDAMRIKEIEAITNHDVKAVEYWLKEIFDELGETKSKEFIHFGLTSQDINNTSNPRLLKNANEEVLLPLLKKLQDTLWALGEQWSSIPMLARTHGQAASPTRLGKEIEVFATRLDHQISRLSQVEHGAKFGGATGNLNAHKVTYPEIDWVTFADRFVQEKLGLKRQKPTTQIEHYDGMAAIFHNYIRINTILIDLCRDLWSYVSMDYFKQRISKNEVGSSAMPHKVNPIDFENAEGNLGISTALFDHLALKLPISRLQRDLTDSTALRNIGVPVAHMLIALKSIIKGLSKLIVNEQKIKTDLENNWAVVAEALQSILRREGYPSPYEKLKELTRTGEKINQQLIFEFIDNLEISNNIKDEMKAISPHNYLGF